MTSSPRGTFPAGRSAGLVCALRSGGSQEQTRGAGGGPLGLPLLLERRQSKQPAESAIGHCADLQQETGQGRGRAARSGAGKRTHKHTQEKEPFVKKKKKLSAHFRRGGGGGGDKK